MKEKYESPVLEIISFGIQDTILDAPCYTCGGDGCSLDCPADGVCFVDASSF